MHSGFLDESKNEMANGRDETFIEKAGGYSISNGDVTAEERAMTRRILLNLDFRYEFLRLAPFNFIR